MVCFASISILHIWVVFFTLELSQKFLIIPNSVLIFYSVGLNNHESEKKINFKAYGESHHGIRGRLTSFSIFKF